VDKISVVINVVDEEVRLLPRVLRSVKNLADEIVLVDMTSGKELKKEFEGKAKIKLYKIQRLPYVELARNFGISKVTGDWVLLLDPDEEVKKGLKKELESIVRNPKADYYRIPRKNIIFNKWIRNSRWWPDYNIRFFKRGFVNWSEVIHRVPETKGVGLDLRAKEEKAIVHYHYVSVDQFVERLNRYTSAHAKLKCSEGYKLDWRDLVRKPVGEFLSRYFQGEGYKDGMHGFVLAGLQAFSEFIVYIKVWQMMKFKETSLDVCEVIDEIKNVNLDLNYWIADTLVKKSGGIKYRIKRKFRLP